MKVLDHQYPATVVDEQGNIYELDDQPLGRGGQGVVFRTKTSPDIVIKLTSSSSDSPQALRQKLRRRLETVRTLPLEGINLARPLELLRGDKTIGYSMRLLTDMVPIETLIAPPGTQDLVPFFLQGGGLRRRLSLLAKAASMLARLHATPLVYGDISPNNIFISNTTEADQVWFIDADNLAYLSDTPPAIYTPMFGAPELVAGRSGANTLTDTYSFAILAIWVLVQCHPFLGEAVEGGGWDQTSTDLDEKAFAGLLPYIDDKDDPSNMGVTGFSTALELVLSPRLRALLQQTLGPGRTDPLKRPGAQQFAAAFQQAKDLTVSCQVCHSTFFINAQECPWCQQENSRPDLLYLEVRRWDPELDQEQWQDLFQSQVLWRKVIATGESAALNSHILRPTPAYLSDKPELLLELRPNAVHIENLTNTKVFITTSPETRPVQIINQKTLPLPLPEKRWHLHFGDLHKPHRFASFNFLPA